MTATKVEDLLVYQRGLQLQDAVHAISRSPRLLQDLRLKNQLLDAADSVVSNIAEGFEQPTDKAFARYLFISKASAAEVEVRTLTARKRGYINDAPAKGAVGLAKEVARMCVGLAKYLAESDRKRRGLGVSPSK
jgi:four helix bundle protein